MTRYGPHEAQITVTEQGSRLHIRWTGSAFDALRTSFKAHFGTHGQAIYLPEQRVWSLPLRAARQLEEWLSQTCQPDCIDWAAEPASSQSYSAGQSSYRRYNYQGRERTTSTAVAPALAEAKARLFLLPHAPDWAAEVMYRAAMLRTHPDHGGDHDQAVALNSAIEIIRSHQKEVS